MERNKLNQLKRTIAFLEELNIDIPHDLKRALRDEEYYYITTEIKTKIARFFEEETNSLNMPFEASIYYEPGKPISISIFPGRKIVSKIFVYRSVCVWDDDYKSAHKQEPLIAEFYTKDLSNTSYLILITESNQCWAVTKEYIEDKKKSNCFIPISMKGQRIKFALIKSLRDSISYNDDYGYIFVRDIINLKTVEKGCFGPLNVEEPIDVIDADGK